MAAAGAPRVEISARDGGPAATVRLEAAPGGDDEASQNIYRGTLLKLSQAARCQVFAGDAWTDPLDLSVTPLPIIEVEVVVVAPDYALRSTGRVVKLARGMRDFSVLAGSEVKLRLDCDRPIQAAEVTAAGPGMSGTPSFAMRREDGPVGGAEAWTLATSGTPLAAIVAPLRYAIQIHDMEGQTLERPLEGSINLKPDLPPTIAAKTRTPIVLATGTPNIHYDAADEHALSEVWLTWEANSDDVSPSPEARQAGKADVPQAGDAADHESTAAVKREGQIDLCRFTPDAAPRAREGDFALALPSLALKPGDTLKVTFHARNYRGPAAATTADADPPLVFQVTDLAGFEASMYESDQRSASALEEIREKHSTTGESQ